MSYQVLLRDDGDFHWKTEVDTLAEAHEAASLKAYEVLRTLTRPPIEIGENSADFTQLLLVGQYQSLHLLIESAGHRRQMEAFDDIVAAYEEC